MGTHKEVISLSELFIFDPKAVEKAFVGKEVGWLIPLNTSLAHDMGNNQGPSMTTQFRY